ncbi:Zinc finger protein 830 [Habropoda laboriosa]|uniref:Zinc finger protein 830 n=1 Tax=Habropoda laboriosa TaxID=597456 RepID=A0A0L7RGT8_9HYME|nr:Zinc finger protein 830 [Habropoda laboriosa]
MSLKRKLTQDDLRKAMNEHKKKLDAGQLMCILCNIIIRSEAVWPVHLNSKSHKESIALAKKTKLETDTSKVQTFKRPSSPSQEASANKKIKGILKNSTTQSAQVLSNLPPDFFDNSSKPSNGTIPLSTSVIVKVSENDKELVRNVEYKNPIEEEWEKFQKEIKEETAQSAQIIADDQEEATTERQLDEIEEQIRHWSRVMDLVKRKEQVQATDRKQKNADEDVSSGDEAEFDEFLDWRAKNSYK